MIVHRLLLVVAISLANASVVSAFGWGWLWPFRSAYTTTTTASTATTSAASSVASNYAIRIGDRLNTFANLSDSGTTLTNIRINLTAFNGTRIGGRSGGSWFSDVILSAAEEYYREATAVVSERLAWIERATAEATLYANELRQMETGGLLEEFEGSVRTSVLNITAESCPGGARFPQLANETIQEIRNRSRNGCLEERIQHLDELRLQARYNLTKLFDNPGGLESQLENCANLKDDDDGGAGRLRRVACVASAVLGLKRKTLELQYTASRLTASAESALTRARASLVGCVTDLTSYAFEESLRLHRWITDCASRRHRAE